MKTGVFLLLGAGVLGALCSVLYLVGTRRESAGLSQNGIVFVNAPPSEASLLSGGSGPAPLRSTASSAPAAQVSSQNLSLRERAAPTKSVDSEQRDAVWANPTERDLREQARRIPAVDDGTIVTRCAASVCDLIVHVSAYASADDQRAFTKYVTGDGLSISLANTNALIGDVRMSNYDGRLTATISLDRIHR